MSRQRDRIHRAVESRGFTVVSLEWEPPYGGGEMEGMCGGWTLIIDRQWSPNTYPGNDLYGLSVDELLADIDWTLEPTGACDCPGLYLGSTSIRRHPLIRLIGDTDGPLHAPMCKWFIRYHLRWWRVETANAAQRG